VWSIRDNTVEPPIIRGGIGFYEVGNDGENLQYQAKATYLWNNHEFRAGFLFERLLAVRNDLGLLSEQFDPDTSRLVGNFPQAFSHVGVINTARNLARSRGPAEHRREKSPVRAA
jgi:hypothetical protein